MTHDVWKCICWSIAAAAVFISCFLVNAGGAWLGGSGGLDNLLMTVFYVVFWTMFSSVSRTFRILLRVSFAMGLLTFLSSTICFIAVLFGGGEFVMILAILLAVFSAVPMYGLHVFLDWTQLYAATAALSFCWLTFTRITLRKQSGT